MLLIISLVVGMEEQKYGQQRLIARTITGKRERKHNEVCMQMRAVRGMQMRGS